MKATPKKLRDGTWGVLVQGKPKSGDVVTVVTKGGKTWQAHIALVIWSNDEISICSTAKKEQSDAELEAKGYIRIQNGNRSYVRKATEREMFDIL